MEKRKCELLDGCIFFNHKMPDMPAVAEIYKENYCRGDNSECSRFIVARTIGQANVPADLFPNQSGRVKEIIARHYPPASS